MKETGTVEDAGKRQVVVWRGDQVPVQHDIPGPGDLRDDTSAGRVLISSLMRAQLSLSLLCLMLALAVTISFPLIAALVPAVGRTKVAGLPLTLIVLGFAIYPVFLAVGWFYHRQARQLEARFTDLVDPPGRGTPQSAIQPGIQPGIQPEIQPDVEADTRADVRADVQPDKHA